MLDAPTALAAAVAAFDVGVFAYGAYWALEIRKALISPLYRRQALWVGAIAIYLAAFFLSIGLGQTLGVKSFGDTQASRVAVGAFIYIGAVMFFVWIDSTIRIARRSDPLRRNTLKWGLLRWFFGFFVIIGTFLALLFNAAQALDFAQATPLYGPIGAILLFGAIALLKSGRRSADPVLKTHLKWFGLFAGFLWATSGAEGTTVWRAASNDPLVRVVSYLLFAIAAYFLYRSARSLAPIAQLPPPTAQPLLGTTA
jgi:hypothetical protein